ncbi:MAG TPA: response regulator transcription factor, partial [Phototrophicaceae bacterium]|nr:response regulator transcription factor [Phototrophicaceae bacterium]
FPAMTLPIEEKQTPVLRNGLPSEGRRLEEEHRRSAKVLVVDDDLAMQRMLKSNLERAGYAVISAADGNSAIQMTLAERPDLITLDIYLPDATGFELCTRLREFTTIPIIIVTCSANERDMIRGLSVGADDYLVKPLHTRELLARVEASLRRAYLADMPNYFEGETVLRAGEITINVAQREVIVRGQEVKLTPIEYKLLYYLIINAGRVLTHEQLVAKVWGEVCRQETQYLWVNISRLRAKIERDSDHPEYVVTERGVGYYFAVPLDTPARRA